MKLTETSNKVIGEEITKYKESNKDVKIKVRRKYLLNTYLILKTFNLTFSLILILYFVQSKEKRVC